MKLKFFANLSLLLAFIFALFFLIGAFYEMKINPIYWGKFTRFHVILGFIVASFFSTFGYIAKYKDRS